MDYCVGMKTVMERLIGIEFYDVMDKSVFYKSKSHPRLSPHRALIVCVCVCVCVASRYSFGDVLFHGCEWSLFQLDLLLFGVIEVISNSYPLAAVITLLVSWVSCCYAVGANIECCS